MYAASARVAVCLLMTSFVTLDATGTDNKRHVTTATRLAPGVAGAQISRPTTANDTAATSHHDVDKLRTGSGKWKHKYSAVDDPDYSASSSSEDGTRQKRYAEWSNRKHYGGLLARSARNLVGVGWNKRPRYNREDGATRDWRTNMMRVWGKRSGGRRVSGSL